jgi:Sulfotransferase domain
MNCITLSAEALFRSMSVETLQCDHEHILVACFPKSGSTWLSVALSRLPSFHKVDLVPLYGRREQELAFERLLLFHTLNYVAQHHCRLSDATERCLNTFSIKPIILIRNIFDCVVSMKDFLDTGVKNPEVIIVPSGYVPQTYHDWHETEKYNFIIDMIIPWYFNFFVGWLDFQGGTWVSYEELVAEPSATIRRIAGELRLNVSDSTIINVLAQASTSPTRKNVGGVGRGHTLTKQQKDRVRKFASYYPSVDFSLIGL